MAWKTDFVANEDLVKYYNLLEVREKMFNDKGLTGLTSTQQAYLRVNIGEHIRNLEQQVSWAADRLKRDNG